MATGAIIPTGRCVTRVVVRVYIVDDSCPLVYPMYADVWSLGVILYMLIVGRSPFSYGNPSETLTNIMDGKYEIPTHVSDQCRDLISRMLVVDTNSRPVLDEIKAHPWLQGCHDVEPTSPLLSTLGEVPEEDSEYILQRMELGNFGSKEDIVK